MKQFCCVFLAICQLFVSVPVRAEADVPVLLASCKDQNDWTGDYVRTLLDVDGNIYQYTGGRGDDEQMENDCARCTPQTRVGTVAPEALAQLKRAIAGIAVTECEAYSIMACDAGSTVVRAYRMTGDKQETIDLWEGGDVVAENMDSNALIAGELLAQMNAGFGATGRLGGLAPYGTQVPLTFSFERGSYNGGYRTYTLTRSLDRVEIAIQGANGDSVNVRLTRDAALLIGLQEILEQYDVAAWDGFSQSDPDVLDGYGFFLHIDYAVRTVTADGYMRKPANYDEASAALEKYLIGEVGPSLFSDVFSAPEQNDGAR